MFHNRFVTVLWRLMQPPERQTVEEYESCPNTVIPLGLVYLYVHRLEVFCDFGVIEIVHFVNHADSGVNNGEGTTCTSALAKP